MWAVIAGILIVIWLLSFVVLHVSSFLIHILLFVGVIALVVHFVRGRKA
jgi:hypothetical protein